jgi:colanic acid/amylovoran biosynthesis glycosyltransferase
MKNQAYNDERPLRIAYLVGSYPAQSETFIRNEIRVLLERGHDVTVYADRHRTAERAGSELVRYAQDRPKWKGARVLRAFKLARDTQRLITPERTIALTKLMAKGAGGYESSYRAYAFARDPLHDVLHCHFGPAGLQGMDMVKLGLASRRLVVTFHAYDVVKYPIIHGTRVYDDLFEAASRILVISNYMRDRLLSLGCPSDKMVVHHAGVDLRQFRFQPPAQSGEAPVRFLFVGRLVDKKGLSVALDALRMLGPEYPWRLRILGTGGLSATLHRQAELFGIADRVEFLGARRSDEVAAEMQQADLLIAPSRTDSSGNQEGIPVVLMEAMASGLPVVSTYHSGIPELVEQGVTGFLAEENNAASLLQTLEDAIQARRQWSEITQRARVVIENNFNIHQLVTAQVRIYQDILSAGNGDGG